MTLAGALAAIVHTITGTFTNKSLHAVVTAQSMTEYTSTRMTYDLRRPRLKGLIARLPRSNAHRITDDGLQFAVFYTKVHDRLLTPLLAADQPPAPPEVRQALAILAQRTDGPTAPNKPDRSPHRSDLDLVAAVDVVEICAQVAVDGVEVIRADDLGPLLFGLGPQFVGQP
jgi:hypothetical protein